MDPAALDVTITSSPAADHSVAYMTASRPAPDPWNLCEVALLRAIADQIEETQRHIDLIRFDPEFEAGDDTVTTRATIIWGEQGRSVADRMGMT